MQPPRHLAQLSIWRSELGILDIDTQLNSLNSINALWKDPMLYQLN